VIALGKVKKGQPCSVNGCGKPASRSISPSHEGVLLRLGLRVSRAGRRIYLCDEHYKMFKKAHKKEERLEKWRMMG